MLNLIGCVLIASTTPGNKIIVTDEIRTVAKGNSGPVMVYRCQTVPKPLTSNLGLVISYKRPLREYVQP